MKKVKVNNEYLAILEEFSNLIVLAGRSRWELIRHNFEMGKKVTALRLDAKYGDKIIPRLAKDLSQRNGKSVFPTDLYQYGTVFKHFGSIDKIEELENKSANGISWHFLVQSIERDERMKELGEKVKTTDPEYLIHLRGIKNGVGKLRRWLKRNELTEETRRAILAELNFVNSDVLALLKEVGDKPTAAQQNVFGAINSTDFALKEQGIAD